MPLNSVFGTANDAGAFFPSSLTRATPSVALAFSDFASNGSGNCNEEVLQPANRARQTTTDNGWRKKAKLGLWQGCIQFPFKTLGVPVLREREADSLFSDALQTLAARQSGARRKTPQRPSALLATRAKMPPSSRTMPRSSQSTLISATPSTPTETRFDSASRSSSTVLPHHDIPANLPATVVSTATDGTSARTHFRASGVGKAERSTLGAKTSPAKMEATRSRRFQRAKA